MLFAPPHQHLSETQIRDLAGLVDAVVLDRDVDLVLVVALKLSRQVAWDHHHRRDVPIADGPLAHVVIAPGARGGFPPHDEPLGLGRGVEKGWIEAVATRVQQRAAISGRYSAPTTTTSRGFCSSAEANLITPIPRIG